MTLTQRARIYRQHQARLVAWEAFAVRKIRAALSAQIRAVTDVCAKSGVVVASAQITALVQPADVESALVGIYERIGEASARTEYERLTPKMKADGPGLGIGFFSERWVSQMRTYAKTDAATHVQSITDTTRRQLREALDEAAIQRLDPRKAARLIQEKTSGAILRRRALLIARTETTAAAGRGAVLGAESTGLKLEKLWIATRDNRTRDTHRAMDGKRVGKGEAFEVGGRLMQHPGDPSGGASNVCNCRCALAHVPARAAVREPAPVRVPRVNPTTTQPARPGIFARVLTSLAEAFAVSVLAGDSR